MVIKFLLVAVAILGCAAAAAQETKQQETELGMDFMGFLFAIGICESMLEQEHPDQAKYTECVNFLDRFESCSRQYAYLFIQEYNATDPEQAGRSVVNVIECTKNLEQLP